MTATQRPVRKYLALGYQPETENYYPASEDEEDDLEGQPPPEIQEDQVNQRMLSGGGPDDPAIEHGFQGDEIDPGVPGGTGAYLNSPEHAEGAPGPDFSHLPGLGAVPAGMAERAQAAPLPPAPTVGQTDTWLNRIAQKLRLSQDANTGPATTGGAPPTLSDRYKALEAEYAKMPTRGTPNWLERIAALGLGGAAGYSNAARRAPPINIGEAVEGVLHPGYQGQLAAWQSRVAPLEKAAEISAQQAAAGWKGQQIQSEAQLHQAQAQMALERGNYYRNLASQNRTAAVPVTKELAQMSGGAFQEGQTIPAADAMRISLAYAAKAEKEIEITTPEMATATGQPVGAKVPASVYTAGVNANNRPERNVSEWQSYLDAAGGDPKKALEQYRADKIQMSRELRAPVDQEGRDLTHQIARENADRRTQDDRDKILNSKGVAEQNAWQQNRLANENADKLPNAEQRPAEKIKAAKQLAAQLQSAHDRYYSEWKARGLDPGDDYQYTVDETTGAVGRAVRKPPAIQFSPTGRPLVRALPQGKPDPSQFVRQ